MIGRFLAFMVAAAVIGFAALAAGFVYLRLFWAATAP